MGVLQEALGGGLGIGEGAIAKVSAVAVAAGTAFKSVVKVNEGEKGVRTRYGRATRTRGRRAGELYGIVEPGMHFVVPFTHSVNKISVRDRSNDLGELQVDREGKQYLVRGSIVWYVMPDGDNPYRAQFNIQNETELTSTVVVTCAGALREVVSLVPLDTPVIENEAFESINEICAEELAFYGVALKRLRLPTVTPTLGQMLRGTSNGHSNTAPLAAGIQPDINT